MRPDYTGESQGSLRPRLPRRPKPYANMALHTIVNHREQDTINRAFIRGHWFDSLLLAKDRTALNTSTYKAHWRLMSYISSPTHNMDHALRSIAVALGDILAAQGLSHDPLHMAHIRKSRLAVTKALVLGILYPISPRTQRPRRLLPSIILARAAHHKAAGHVPSAILRHY